MARKAKVSDIDPDKNVKDVNEEYNENEASHQKIEDTEEYKDTEILVAEAQGLAIESDDADLGAKETLYRALAKVYNIYVWAQWDRKNTKA